MPANKTVDYILLHFVILIWGATGVVGKLITLPANVLVWYRMLIAAVCIALYCILIKKSLKVDRKGLFQLFVAGVIIAMHWICFFHSIQISNVSVCLATLSTGALFTAFLEPVFYKRRIRISEIIMGISMLIGLVIMFNAEADHLDGMLYALGAAFLSALFSVINGRLSIKYEPTLITFYEMVGGFIFIGTLWSFSDNFYSQILNITTTDFWFLLFLGVFCTAIAFIISVRIMRSISPYTMMLSLNLEPVYGILLAWIILGDSEEMTPNFYLGVSIILLTIVVNSSFKYAKRKMVQVKRNSFKKQ